MPDQAKSSVHPETVITLRILRPDLNDIPAEALERLMVARWVSLRLHVRDTGRAVRKSLIGR